MLPLLACVVSCGNKTDGKSEGDTASVSYIDAEGQAQAHNSASTVEGLPYSGDAIREHVVLDYGNRTVRTDADKSFSFPDKMKNKKSCFIVMSKKDYYLYVYEPQGSDTVLLARYDCAFSMKKGQKEQSGDMRTPHCTLQAPFSIQEIVPAHSWMHDFGDGRGSIRSYGDYFLRLFTPGHKGIGIHGSTNNRESVPGRASEGCIRLKDEDIKDLAEHYAFSGMKVIIKAEQVDDYPFEIHAFKRQHIERKRHFDPAKTLTNEQIETAQPEQGRSLPSAQPVASQPSVQPAQGLKTVFVKGNDVRLRLGPGTSFGFLANADGHAFLLRNGESLPCAGEIADWYKVKYQGKTYYVSKRYATPK